jgi:hypothetical protein
MNNKPEPFIDVDIVVFASDATRVPRMNVLDVVDLFPFEN